MEFGRKQSLKSKSGFIILEALICLAVLAILLPFTYKVVLQARKNYHFTLLRERASQLANFELSKLETQVLKGYFDMEEIKSKYEFHLDQQITDEAEGLKKISVQVTWQTSDGPQAYSLQEWVFLNRVEKSKERLG